MQLTAFPSANAPSTIACDVGCYTINLFCRDLSGPGSVAEWEIPNRTEPITTTLLAIRERAAARGITSLRVVVEPTGIYHKVLLQIANSMGFQTGLVDASHVKKMRAVIFGDSGKTDTRDPYAIEAVVAQGRVIADRRPAEVYLLLRQWGKLYRDAEVALIDAKSRVHRIIKLLFPDFDFTTDFLYGPSGQAIMRCFGFDPHVIAALNVARMYERLRKQSKIQRLSVTRLLAQARQTVSAIAKSRVTGLQARELAFAWEDVDLALRRREAARVELEALYDEARASDSHLPDLSRGVRRTHLPIDTSPRSSSRSCGRLPSSPLPPASSECRPCDGSRRRTFDRASREAAPSGSRSRETVAAPPGRSWSARCTYHSSARAG